MINNPVRYSFDGGHLVLQFNGKQYSATMGGLFPRNACGYAAFFGFLIAEIEHQIAGNMHIMKLHPFSWSDMWTIKDALSDKIRSGEYLACVPE